jgi:hypothetical protein
MDGGHQRQSGKFQSSVYSSQSRNSSNHYSAEILQVISAIIKVADLEGGWQDASPPPAWCRLSDAIFKRNLQQCQHHFKCKKFDLLWNYDRNFQNFIGVDNLQPSDGRYAASMDPLETIPPHQQFLDPPLASITSIVQFIVLSSLTGTEASVPSLDTMLYYYNLELNVC